MFPFLYMFSTMYHKCCKLCHHPLHTYFIVLLLVMIINPLSAKFIKWSNTFKQIVGKLPTICLSVFDHFSGLALKGLMFIASTKSLKNLFDDSLFFLACRVCGLLVAFPNFLELLEFLLTLHRHFCSYLRSNFNCLLSLAVDAFGGVRRGGLSCPGVIVTVLLSCGKEPLFSCHFHFMSFYFPTI